MTDLADWNARVIDEFRANEGRVGGRFEGAPLLLLHSTGARTGKERVNPMMYQRVDDGYAVRLEGRAPTTPTGTTTSSPTPGDDRVGTDTVEVTRGPPGRRARTDLDGAEGALPGFAEYEERTDREIPVVLLAPVG